jgi:hypothetical protein
MEKNSLLNMYLGGINDYQIVNYLNALTIQNSSI